MSAKDKAFNKSLILTEQRIAELARQRELDQTESLPVTYQGHDAATGTAKFSRGGDCCDYNIISGGETITTGAIAIGETVLSRPTEGNIRLDRKPSISNPTECGSGGSPSPRTFGGDGGGAGKVVPEPGYTCPAKGTIKAGSRRTVGLAEQYEIYTGEKKSGVKIGGAPKELWEVCQTETVTIPNSPNAVSQSSPYSGRNGDDGCVNPAKPPKRCQWYDVTEEQALNLTGAPEGMFVSGYVEYPEGTFRILACMEEDEPANDEGTGFDWNPANVIESGAASEGVIYCSTAFTGEIAWNGGNVVSQNPGVSYSLTPAGEVFLFEWDNGQSYLSATQSYTTRESYLRISGTASCNPSAEDRTLIALQFYSSVIGRWIQESDVVVYSIGSQLTGLCSGDWSRRQRVNGGGFVIPPSILTNNQGAPEPNPDGVINFTQEVFFKGNSYLPTPVYYPGRLTIEGNNFAIRNINSLTITPTGGDAILSVTDSTGTIFTQEYETEPTGFSFVCRSNTPNC